MTPRVHAGQLHCTVPVPRQLAAGRRSHRFSVPALLLGAADGDLRPVLLSGRHPSDGRRAGQALMRLAGPRAVRVPRRAPLAVAGGASGLTHRSPGVPLRHAGGSDGPGPRCVKDGRRRGSAGGLREEGLGSHAGLRGSVSRGGRRERAVSVNGWRRTSETLGSGSHAGHGQRHSSVFGGLGDADLSRDPQKGLQAETVVGPRPALGELSSLPRGRRAVSPLFLFP